MIRKIEPTDRAEYLAMAEAFYTSDAVLHPVPRENFERTFDALCGDSPYCEGYLMICDDVVAGFALLAKTFTQEAGGMVYWLEDLYVKPDFRGRGLGHEFFKFLRGVLPAECRRVRLEVERDNERAISLYTELGFVPLPYDQMMRELG